MDDLLDLAGRQGYVTTSDAANLGVNRMALSRLVASGVLLHTVRSVYLLADDRTPEQRHAAVVRATLKEDPWSVASHHSALVLHGINVFGAPFDQVQVADPRRSSRSHQSLHRHVLREGDPVVEVEGLKALGLPLALCQTATRFGMVAGLVAMDHALHLERCTPDDLQAVIESGRLRRGIGAARRAVSLADGRAESPGESRLRAIIAGGPFPYDLQVNVGGPGSGYRADLMVDGLVVLEFDGAVKYDGVEGKTALIAEKRREDWIREKGYGFMRTMTPELDYPVTINRTLHQKVVEARARRAA